METYEQATQETSSVRPERTPAASERRTRGVRDRPAWWRRRRARVNVHPVERVASALLGGLIAGLGARRRSVGGTAIALIGGELVHRGVTGRCPLYRALDVNTAPAAATPDAANVPRTITIGLAADEVYRFWRDPMSLGRIFGHFADVTPVGGEDPVSTHWVCHAPLGRTIEWDARLAEDRPGQLLRWETSGGTRLLAELSVSFRRAPADFGTEVTLHLRFDPPAGQLGEAALRLFDFVPRLLAEKALRRCKSLLETGELPSLEHNPSAREARRSERRAESR